MIDFRYHLVSLVAVFMALAVGIVLGAGPLGQEISSTLEGQVKELREERNGLRAQLDQSADREEFKDQAFQVVTPALTHDQLTGRRVAIITMPGTDRNIVGQVQDQLTSAGAAVVLTVRLDDEWSDPETLATRNEAAAELAPVLGDPDPRESAEPTVETVLAAALAGQDEVTGSGAWRGAIDRLEELNFISTNWADNENSESSDAPDTFVIVTGDLDVQEVEEEESGNPRLQQSLDLIAAFGVLGTPTVVAGYGTESYADPVQAAESPIVRGVRAESALAESVASVDNVEGASGQLALVLGLRWMIDGEPGHWGVGTDALAPMPSVPEPVTPESEDLEGPTLPFEPVDPGAGEGQEDETDLGNVGTTPTGSESGPVGPVVAPTDPEPTTGAPTP